MNGNLLPFDILGELFNEIIVSTYFDKPRQRFKDYPQPTLQAIRLSAVCTFWRCAALDFPAIWSYIGITIPLLYTQAWTPQQPIIDLAMARSQGTPLHVRVEAPHILPENFIASWTVLSKLVMARAGFIEIISTFEMAGHRLRVFDPPSLSRFLLYDSPCLTELSYRIFAMSRRRLRYSGQSNIVFTASDWDRRPSPLLPCAPRLRSLHIHNLGGLNLDHLFGNSLRGLRSLVINAPRNAVISVADLGAVAPELCRLELGYYLQNRAFEGSKSTLPHLKSVHGDASLILFHLERGGTPNIQTLDFSGEEEDKFSNAPLAAFLQSQPYMAVTTLFLPTEGLDESDSILNLVPMFGLLPCIHLLVFPDYPPVMSFFKTWSESTNVCSLPQLEKIQFGSTWFPSKASSGSTPEIVQFLEARKTSLGLESRLLHFELEFITNKSTHNVEPLWNLLALLVKKLRVVGGVRHPQHGVVLIEAIDGLVCLPQASSSARE